MADGIAGLTGEFDAVIVLVVNGAQARQVILGQGGVADRIAPGGPQLNQQVKQATRALSLAFLHSVFKGDDRALAAWPQQFAGIVARYTRSSP